MLLQEKEHLEEWELFLVYNPLKMLKGGFTSFHNWKFRCVIKAIVSNQSLAMAINQL